MNVRDVEDDHNKTKDRDITDPAPTASFGRPTIVKNLKFYDEDGNEQDEEIYDEASKTLANWKRPSVPISNMGSSHGTYDNNFILGYMK